MDWWWHSCRIEHLQKGRPPFIHTFDGILFCWHWNRCGLAQTNGMKTPRSSTGNLSKKRCTSWRWNKRDRKSTKLMRDTIISPYSPTVHQVRRWAFTSNNHAEGTQNINTKLKRRRFSWLIWGLLDMSSGFWYPLFSLIAHEEKLICFFQFMQFDYHASFFFFPFYVHG